MKKLMMLITFLLPVFPASAVTIMSLTPDFTYSISKSVLVDGDLPVPTTNQFALFAYTGTSVSNITKGPALLVGYDDVLSSSVAGGLVTITNLSSNRSISNSVYDSFSLATRSGGNPWWLGSVILESEAVMTFRFQDDLRYWVEPLYADLNQMAVSAVPVPAAVWLFGSGLIGLAGLARRKKA